MTWKQQLLVILMEECGELTQSASKVARFGFEPEKVEELAKEAGDVLCMIDLMVEFGWITQEQLDNRIPIKRNKLKIYSDILR
jgi:regulator of RNase E activity RraB